MRYNLESNVEEAINAWRSIESVSPINGDDINGFHNWINWNGYKSEHKAFDFAAYVNKSVQCFLGLPKDTLVRAIADGKVMGVYHDKDPFTSEILTEHDKVEGYSLLANYSHVIPLVSKGERVRRGKPIARLYSDPGFYSGRLVHLDLMLVNPYSEPGNRDFIDPLNIFDFGYLQAVPENRGDFRIEGLKEKPEIRIANYRRLRI
jgi:hypothetical protein